MILLYHENYICASYLFNVVLVEEDIAREAAFKAKQQAQHFTIRRPESEYIPPNIAELNRKIDSMRH